MQKNYKSLLKDPGHLLASGFGTGFLRPAPGTWGTLVGVLLVLPLKPTVWWLYVIISILLFILGVWVCGRMARVLGLHDDPSIVWDEVVGFLTCMAILPNTWLAIGLGFVLFRLFDILKPWPISVMDKRLDGGFGIMADDVAAGVFAGLVGLLCLNFLSS